MKNQSFLFLVIFLKFNLFCDIHESNTIKIVHDHVYFQTKEGKSELSNKNCLVVLDLDNTTMHPHNHDHGSDQWFNAAIEHMQKEHKLNFMSALDLVLPEYIDLQKTAEMVPVEKEIIELISKFQKDNIPVIAVTARSLPLEGTTIKQLSSINIDFSHNCLALKKEFELDKLDHPCKYKNGILFVSNNDKGKALIRFLDYVSHTPEKVICADDKLKHIEHVERACKEKNIEFVGIRYSHCDDKVKSYSLPKEHKIKLSKFVPESKTESPLLVIK